MVLLFCHIEKCAGTTLVKQFRERLGVRHVDLIPANLNSNVAEKADLTATLRLVPFALAVAGHSIRPHIDYGSAVAKVTLLRDPVKRYISEFRHDQERRGYKGSFEQWSGITSRRNHQTRFIAGDESLDQAKRILEYEMALFGVAERYDEFFELLSLWLPQMKSASSAPRNQSKAQSDITALDLEIARELNQVDIALHKFATDLFTEKKPHWASHLSPKYWFPGLGTVTNLAFRNLYYKPLMGIRPFQAHALPVNAVNAEVAQKLGLDAHKAPSK